MATSCPSCATRKNLEDEFTTYGMNLMNPPSSIDGLLKLLEKVESLLKLVGHTAQYKKQHEQENSTNLISFMRRL